MLNELTNKIDFDIICFIAEEDGRGRKDPMIKNHVRLRIINKGFNYSQDGPGNRLVYHLAGCNMCCPWCSNPEGMDPDGVYMLEMNGTKHLSYQEIDADQIIAETLSTIPILIDGGGVTFSGGEPTLQFEALSQVLETLHNRNIHTAIETNGTNPNLKKLISSLDLIIVDFKHPDSEEHKKYTGLGNEAIIANLRDISHMGIPVWIRTPLINGVNSSDKCREAFIQTYTDGFDLNQVSFELLSYHEFGRKKWEKCGKNYTVQNGYVTSEVVRKFEDTYRAAGLTVIRT